MTTVRLPLVLGILLSCAGPAAAGDPWRASWIWDAPRANIDDQPTEPRYFRKTLDLESGANQAHTLVLVDNTFELFVNGREVGRGRDAWPPAEFDISEHLHAGRNVIAICATNEGGPAGLFFESNLTTQTGRLVNIVTDDSWRVAATRQEGWTELTFDDADWSRAVVLGRMGTAPWGRHGKPGRSTHAVADEGPLPASESVRLFTLPPGFEVQIVAEEPDVINPVVMALDEEGRLFVAEAHTYRWGEEKSPVTPPSNPVALLELDGQGRARRTAVVADGFTDPIMGIVVRDGNIWLSALNRVYVAELQPDGTAGPLRTILRDTADPWNPFGMFQLEFGPDGWMYLIVGDHQAEMIGSDGTTIRTRGSTGSFFRFRPDGTGLELLSQGMRAPFSFDFDPWGRIWILSNGEGNPNRLLKMIPTVDYHFQTRHGTWAWLAGEHAWSPPVTEMERGANTQVLCYLDGAYPERYWGRLFVSNWGAHGFAGVNRKVDIYTPDERGNIRSVEVFLDTADPMFRPTQLLPTPEGDLYMLDWYGRDDENNLFGRIYRIVYTGTESPRAIAARSINADPTLTPEQRGALRDIQGTDRRSRDRAMDTLARDGGVHVVDAIGRLLNGHDDPFVATRLLWVLRRIGTARATDVLTGALRSPEPASRAMAVRLLRELDPPDLAERIAPLKEEEDDPETCVELALCEADPARRTAALHRALDRGAKRDRRLRYQCAVELSRVAPVEGLIALVAGEDPEVRAAGWIALDVGLHEQVNPAMREALAALLVDTPAGREDELLEVCAQWADVATIPALQAFVKQGSRSPSRLAAALAILSRFGDEGMAGLPPDVASRFFAGIAGGTVVLNHERDRISSLALLEMHRVGEAGGSFLAACMRDASVNVRRRAIAVMRVVGWRYPDLFDELWAVSGRTNRPLEERIEAIAALGRQPDPPADRWRGLLDADEPAIVRMALRMIKGFAGNDAMHDMMREAAPALIARDGALRDEVAAVLDLYGEEAAIDGLTADIPLVSTNLARTQRLMLERMPTASPLLGRETFASLGCTSCHDVSGTRALFGPSLRGIGEAATPAYIAESILAPAAVIKDGFEAEEVMLRGGERIVGRVEQQGDDLIIHRGVDDAVVVPADRVDHRRKLDSSLMPDLMLDGVSLDELADLLAYLVSQGGDPSATVPVSD